VQPLYRLILLLTARSGKLQGEREALIERVQSAELLGEEVFKVKKQRLALPEDADVQARHRAMLNLIPQLYEEFEVSPLR
jgi:hypothetical protein